MNRTPQNQFQGKRPPSVNNQQQRKTQRTFHIATMSKDVENDYSEDEPSEVNFLA